VVVLNTVLSAAALARDLDGVDLALLFHLFIKISVSFISISFTVILCYFEHGTVSENISRHQFIPLS
jgi:hypothetical protein